MFSCYKWNFFFFQFQFGLFYHLIYSAPLVYRYSVDSGLVYERLCIFMCVCVCERERVWMLHSNSWLCLKYVSCLDIVIGMPQVYAISNGVWKLFALPTLKKSQFFVAVRKLHFDRERTLVVVVVDWKQQTVYKSRGDFHSIVSISHPSIRNS